MDIVDGSGLWSATIGVGAGTFYTLRIDAELAGVGGGWTDITEDVYTDPPVVIAYGIDGSGPLDRIARTGQLTFGLDNSDQNSGGLKGYYSPGNSSVRTGWNVGIRVRCVVEYDGTSFYKFIGTLNSVEHAAGAQTDYRVLCTVLDWMDDAAKQRTANIATQTGKRADEIISTVVSNMTRQPISTSYAEAQMAYPYALDTAEDEKTSAMTELARAVMSDLGYLYIKGDTSAGGVLRFEDRRVRQAAVIAQSTLVDVAEMAVARSRDAIYNRLKVAINPRRVDAAATTVLYQYDAAQLLAIGPSETVTIVGQYRDPDQRAQRVGGVDLVAPVAYTDYAFGTGPGDTSLTANLSVTATTGGNSAIIELTNGGAASGFVTLLQVRGRGLYDYDQVVLQDADAASRTAYGEFVLSIDLPHEARQHVAQSILDVMLARYKDPRDVITSLTFDAATSALLSAALAREPGDLVAIAENESGVDANYFINGVRYSVEWPGLKCSWILAPDYDTATVFVLNTSTLNGAHVLGW